MWLEFSSMELFKYIGQLIRKGFKNPLQQYRLIQQKQKVLVTKGVSAKAEVLRVDTVERNLGHYFSVRLGLQLQNTESTESIFTSMTILPPEKIPHTGDVINLRYLPGDHSVILIL